MSKTQKSELIERLVSFVCHDTIFYLSENQSAKKYLTVANAFLSTHFQMCDAFITAESNVSQNDKVEAYLGKLNSSKIVGLYLSATELRSVLLGILFVEGKITVDEAFECGFAEELTEQKKWGTLEEIEQRHKEVIERLKEAKKVANA